MAATATSAMNNAADGLSGAPSSKTPIYRVRHKAYVGRRLWWRWIVATEVGHIAGAVLWALPASWLLRGPGELGGPASTAAMFGLTMVAATVQGLLLGVAQSTILRRVLPVPRGAWALATAVGVAVGWLILVVATRQVDAIAREGFGFVAWVALGGAVFGAIVGGSQATVLARYVRHVRSWVGVSVVAWGVALLVTVGVFHLFGQSSVSALGTGAVAAAGAGIAIGVITATQLVRTVR